MAIFVKRMCVGVSSESLDKWGWGIMLWGLVVSECRRGIDEEVESASPSLSISFSDIFLSSLHEEWDSMDLQDHDHCHQIISPFVYIFTASCSLHRGCSSTDWVLLYWAPRTCQTPEINRHPFQQRSGSFSRCHCCKAKQPILDTISSKSYLLYLLPPPTLLRGRTQRWFNLRFGVNVA